MMISPHLKVLDISHHNTVDPEGFSRMHAFGIRGVIHKATQGTGYVDPLYTVRRNAATKAGLLGTCSGNISISLPVAAATGTQQLSGRDGTTYTPYNAVPGLLSTSLATLLTTSTTPPPAGNIVSLGGSYMAN